MVVSIGVLADVERCQVQAERSDRADQPIHPTSRSKLTAMSCQRVTHHRQVVEQLGRAEVVVTGLVLSAGSDATASVGQSLCDAPALEAIGLFGVDAQYARVKLRQRGDVRLDTC